MLLALDIGNTNIVIGLFDGQSLVGHWRLATDTRRTADEYALALQALLAQAGRTPSEITAVALSSVVPPLTPVIVGLLEQQYPAEVLVVGPDTDTGMPLRYLKPYEIGADRIVNAVAAYQKYGGPLVVVDFGTATTFDAVSADGAYLGGAIAPGIGISIEALFQRAARLAGVELAAPEQAIGQTTEAGLQAGIVFGFAGLVDELVRRISAELPERPHVIATGGLADLVAGEASTIEHVDPLLTLEGLRLIHERSRQAGSAEQRG